MSESEDLLNEVGAIEAIFPECIEKLTNGVYKFRVPQHEHILFQMSFPVEYPNEKPFVLDVISEKDGFDESYLMELFQEVLDSIYHEGDVIIFDLFTELDAVLYTGDDDNDEILNDEDHWNSNENESSSVKSLEDQLDDTHLTESGNSYENYVYDEKTEISKKTTAKKHKDNDQLMNNHDPLEGWIVSDPITDRKSTFVSFAREVHSVDEADKFLGLLLEDRRCGRSSHAMRAWRIKDEKTGVKYQDCDDDGETAAGGRMLHLMTIMDAWNVMVVCCRWFGGVHIGPDRFKHINSATRDALVKGGFVDVNSNSKKSKKKK